MFLLVRDEDAPTVSAAIKAFAEEEGLLPLDLEAQAKNPLEMLSVLSGPRVIVSAHGDQIAAFGLESLDIAEPEEWATAISAACSAEVLAFEPADDGVRVYVFDDGEADETIEVALHPSGRTRVPALAPLTDDDAGKKALEAGLVASSGTDLMTALLRAFGVSAGPGDDTLMLAFVDPLDEEDDGQDDDGADDAGGRLVVDPLPAAELNGRVGAEVRSRSGNLFVVTLEGTTAIEGLRFEVSGDGLALFDVEAIDIAVRVRGGTELEPRQVAIEGAGENEAGRPTAITIEMPDAYLERTDALLPTIDPSDMFATMQRIMSAGESRQLNTLLVDVRGTARHPGEGTLLLTVSATSDTPVAEPGQAGIAVHVR